MTSAFTPESTPEGPGSVSGAPNLPAGFADTFTSRYVDDRDRSAAANGSGRHAAAVSST